MPSDIPKNFKKIAKKADKQGWGFRKTKSGYQLQSPDGENSVTIHKTPSERSIANYKSDMAKYGYKD